jgi:hypothetical protein
MGRRVAGIAALARGRAGGLVRVRAGGLVRVRAGGLGLRLGLRFSLLWGFAAALALEDLVRAGRAGFFDLRVEPGLSRVAMSARHVLLEGRKPREANESTWTRQARWRGKHWPYLTAH